MEVHEPPFSVNVAWSAESRGPLCKDVARALYEFLRRPLDKAANLALEPGVGIPVYLGTNAEALRRRAPNGEAPHVTAGDACRAVVLLLDQEAQVDEGFKEAVRGIMDSATESDWRQRIVLPVLLDETWAGKVPEHLTPCRAALYPPQGRSEVDAVVEEVSVGICHFLMDRRSGGAEPPGLAERKQLRIFISHTKSDIASTDNLAGTIRDYVAAATQMKSFFDVNDIARGRDLIAQLESSQGDAICLSLRTDGYAESPYCLQEVLTAKKLGVPIVAISALETEERRSLAYAGNSPMLAAGGKPDVGRFVRKCLQAWLHHLHFHHQAPHLVRRYRELAVDPIFLSRSPELLDFAQDVLPSDSSTLVVYPDAPLPESELKLLRRVNPRVRFATPTTLFHDVLDRNPSPPLDGMRVALSLSDSPDVSAFEKEGSHVAESDEASRIGAVGLVDCHVKEVASHLTLCMVRGGAALGYGGHLESMGFTPFLARLVASHKRTTKTAKELFYSYLAAYIWDQKPESASEIESDPIKVPNEAGATTPAGKALQLTQMRRKMAEDCHARVILGGKTVPRDLADGGYFGRLPGQAEEALLHLNEGKPVFVLAGFGGAGAMVARALCGEIERLPFEQEMREKSEEYSRFCDDYAELANDHSSTVDGLWSGLADKGRGYFFGEGADDAEVWTNGLTVAENRHLFTAHHPDEISALVMKGLRTCWERGNRARTSSEHKVVLFHGSIADVPNVDAYAVPILQGAPRSGADAALDERLDGAITRFLDTGRVEGALPVTSHRLSGDWVILKTMGDLGRLGSSSRGASTRDTEQSWLIENIQRAVGQVVEYASAEGLRSVALVPFGASLGLTPEESIAAMVDGLKGAGTGRLQEVVLCEVDPGRYEKVREYLTHAEGIELSELECDAAPTRSADQSAVLLVVQRDGDTLLTYVVAPGTGASVDQRETKIDWRGLLERTGVQFGTPPTFGEDQDSVARDLAKMVLPGAISEALIQHRDLPIDIVHDVESGAIPFELLLLDGPSPLRPALEGGIRRRLLKTQSGGHAVERGRRGVLLRLLLVSDPTGDLPWAREEASRIGDALKGRKDIEVVHLQGSDATTKALVEKLCSGRFDALHFAGHVSFDPDVRDEGGLVLAGGRVLTADDLKDPGIVSLPGVVLLNACQSGRVRKTPATPIDDSINDASLAETILRSGVQAFIGNIWELLDRSGVEFAVSLYGDLADGRAVGDSVLRARNVLFRLESRDWPNYVFYGDPELRL